MEIQETDHRGEAVSINSLFRGATGEEVKYEAKTSSAFDYE